MTRKLPRCDRCGRTEKNCTCAQVAAGLLTVPMAAAELGVTRWHVYDWINSGDLGCIRYPSRNGGRDGAVRIERAELDRFIAACRRPAQGRAS